MEHNITEKPLKIGNACKCEHNKGNGEGDSESDLSERHYGEKQKGRKGKKMY